LDLLGFQKRSYLSSTSPETFHGTILARSKEEEYKPILKGFTKFTA
jgi:hypothetical protein